MSNQKERLIKLMEDVNQAVLTERHRQVEERGYR